MDIKQRAEKLRALAKSQTMKEMANIRATRWAGQISAQRNATQMASHADKMVNTFIDAALKPISGDANIQQANLVFMTTQLDIAESLITNQTQTEMRVAKLQGFQDAMDEQRKRLKKLAESPSDQVRDKVKEFADHAKSASDFVRDLSGDPLKYVNIADKFINGTLAKKLPNVIANKIPSAMNANEFIEFLKRHDISYKPFERAHQFFKNASKFLGVVQIGFEITTIVLETLANQGKWAPTLLRASVAAGSAVVLAEVITTTALSSAIASTFAAAGISAEVPPVAIALLAAGIVMVASLAVVQLYDSLVSLLFGSMSIPRSMRLNMSSQMYTSMSSSMSTPMARAMLSNH